MHRPGPTPLASHRDATADSLVEPRPWMTNSLLHGLAGNAVACPVLLALLMALAGAVSGKDTNAVAEFPWSNEDEEDQSVVLRLLSGIAP